MTSAIPPLSRLMSCVFPAHKRRNDSAATPSIAVGRQLRKTAVLGAGDSQEGGAR